MTYTHPITLACALAAFFPSVAAAEPTTIERCGVVDSQREFADFRKTQFKLRESGAGTKWEGGLRILFSEAGGSVRIVAPGSGYDVNDSVLLEVEIENPSDMPVTLVGMVNDNTSSKGFLYLLPGESGVLVLHLMRLEEDIPDKRFANMKGTPGGFMENWDRKNANHLVKSVEISDLDGRAVGKTVIVKTLVARGKYGEIPAPGLENFFPFVDTYGQYKHASWPGKIKDGADLAATRETELADLQANPGPSGWSRYGGWKDGPRLKATGHFRTEKHGGKWWLVDPEGYLYWSHGVTGVGVGSGTRVKPRAYFFEDLPTQHIRRNNIDFLAANLERKFGPDWKSAHLKISHHRLKSWGMNSAGNWSDDDFCAMGGTPYFVPIHYKSESGNAHKDPEILKKALEARMAKEEKTLNDPWCVGYFVDNELNWAHVMNPDTYYRTVSEVMKRVAPDKLYLGSRIHGQNSPWGGPKAAVSAAAKYCDVVGINRYRFSPSDLRLPDGADKPIVIGEFHFGALDRGMLHPGLKAAGDQNQRARAYYHYVEEALNHPNIVGTHWFQYREQVVTGRSDGENFQIGFVDITDRPSSELVTAARAVGRRMYEIRSGN